MKLKNILFIALLFAGTAVVQNVHAMGDDAAVLDADGDPSGEPGAQPGADSGDEVLDTDTAEGEDERGADYYGEGSWHQRSARQNLRRVRDSILSAPRRFASWVSSSFSGASDIGADSTNYGDSASSTSEDAMRGLSRTSVGAQDFNAAGNASDEFGEEIYQYPDDFQDPADVRRTAGRENEAQEFNANGDATDGSGENIYRDSDDNPIMESVAGFFGGDSGNEDAGSAEEGYPSLPKLYDSRRREVDPFSADAWGPIKMEKDPQFLGNQGGYEDSLDEGDSGNDEYGDASPRQRGGSGAIEGDDLGTSRG